MTPQTGQDDPSIIPPSPVLPPSDPERPRTEPLELSLETAPSRAVDPFAGFWSSYPRKTAKPTAERAYRKVEREAEAIQAGLDAWVRYWKAERTEQKFIPHPATWINRRQWDDAPPPVTGGTAKGPRWTPDQNEDQADRAKPSGKLSADELWGDA